MYTRISVLSDLCREDSEFSCVVQPLLRLLFDEAGKVFNKIRLFVDGANAGMYSGERFSPLLSEAVIVDRQGFIAKEQEAFEIRCRQINWGAIRILINLLSRMLNEYGPQIEINVLGKQGKDYTLSPIIMEEIPYPGVFSSIPFDLEMSYPNRSLDPVSVRIEFARALIGTEVDMIWSALQLWGEVVREGGYSQMVAEEGALPDLSEMEVYMLSPSHVELTVYGFYGSDAAFDGLVSMLSRSDNELKNHISSIRIW